jgi:hypothetical protein
MRAVNRRIVALIFIGAVSLCSTASWADDREDATAVAKAFFVALSEKKFAQIWDTQASDRYKNEMANTREGFIAILTSLRQKIGRLTSSTVVYVKCDPPQPNWAFKGKTCGVIFENVYTTGARQEGVHLLDENGSFKIGSLMLGG